MATFVDPVVDDDSQHPDIVTARLRRVTRYRKAAFRPSIGLAAPKYFRFFLRLDLRCTEETPIIAFLLGSALGAPRSCDSLPRLLRVITVTGGMVRLPVRLSNSRRFATPMTHAWTGATMLTDRAEPHPTVYPVDTEIRSKLAITNVS